MSENPPEKAKKSKKLTITEKNPPKKPPHISEKVPSAPDCFSLCQSALAGMVGLWYNEGAVAGRTAARVVVKALDVVIMLERQGFLFTPSPGRSFVISAFISLNRPTGRARFRLQVQCWTLA